MVIKSYNIILAEFLTSQSRQKEAVFYRVRAAELEPNDYTLVVAAATALRIADRKQEAEMWYRKVCVIHRTKISFSSIVELLYFI